MAAVPVDVSPAGTLRRAAETLRTASAAATPGDWTAHLLPPNEHHSHPAHWVKTEYDDGNTTTSQVVADCPWRQADARYIAAMHPGVGAALAAWLESVSARVDQMTYLEWRGGVEPEALAVAVAVLGEQR